MNDAKKYRWVNSILFCCVFLSLLGWVYYRGQDVNWDLQNYHFYSGYAVLNGRFFEDIAAAKMQTYLYPVANIPAYLLYRYLPFPFDVWGILVIQVISIPIIYKIVSKSYENVNYGWVSWFTKIIFVGISTLSPLWLSELGTSFFSSTTSIFVLGGLYLILAPKNNKYLVLAGVLAGLAVSLKLTNAIFAIGMLVSIVWTDDRTIKEKIWIIACFSFGAILGFLSGIWWNLLLYIQWESPLFPFYNGIFKSQYFPIWSWKDPVMIFKDTSDLFVYLKESFTGTNKASEVAFSDPRIVICLFATVLYWCFGKKNQTSSRLNLFFLSSFLIWAWLFAYQRYLIPIELTLGAVLCVCIQSILNNPRFVILISLFFLSLTLFFIKVPDWGHRKMSFLESNPFGLVMQERESETPAVYVTYGVPMSYIFPYFDSNSRFYSYGLSEPMDNLINNKLIIDSEAMPKRMIATSSDFEALQNRLLVLGFKTNLELCNPIKTAVNKFISCELDRMNDK